MGDHTPTNRTVLHCTEDVEGSSVPPHTRTQNIDSLYRPGKFTYTLVETFDTLPRSKKKKDVTVFVAVIKDFYVTFVFT